MHRHAQSNSDIFNTNIFCLALHRLHCSEMSVSIVFVYKDRSKSTRKLDQVLISEINCAKKPEVVVGVGDVTPHILNVVTLCQDARDSNLGLRNSVQ